MIFSVPVSCCYIVRNLSPVRQRPGFLEMPQATLLLHFHQPLVQDLKVLMFLISFLLLPLVADASFFKKHKVNYLNEEISPCDDFYEHVCSKVPKTENFLALIERKMVQKLEPFYTQRFLDFIGELNKYQNPRNSSEIADNRVSNSENRQPPGYTRIMRSINKWYCYPRSCHYKQVLEVMELVANNTIGDKLIAKIQNFGDYEAFHRYLRNNDTAFSTVEDRVHDYFKRMKTVILNEFEKTPWMQPDAERPEVIPALLDTMLKRLSRNVIDVDYLFNITDLHECIGNSTDENWNRFCAVRVAVNRLDKFERDFDYDTVYDMIRVGFRERRAYRAGYDIFISPVLFDCIEEDFPQMLGSISFVIHHEQSHSVDWGRETSIPASSSCFQLHMNQVCSRTFDSMSCPPGIATYNEDAPDWVGARLSLDTLNKMNPKPSTAFYQDLFYANAMMWCEDKGPQPGDPHSAPKVRVNGIMRQMEEFAEAFSCKSGDFMKLAEHRKCLPLIGETAISGAHILPQDATEEDV